jgi:hypothetical protein
MGKMENDLKGRKEGRRKEGIKERWKGRNGRLEKLEIIEEMSKGKARNEPNLE